MKHEELEKLIHRILTTEDEEIDCSQAAELIAQYVELELSGEDVARLLPEVAQHLRQCDDCFELHEVLHEVAALEQEGALPGIDELLEDIVGSQAEEAESPSQLNAQTPPAETTDPPAVETAQRPSSPPQRRTTERASIPSVERTPRPFWQRWPASWAWATAAVALIVAVGISAWAWHQAGIRARAGEQHLAFIAGADWVVRLKGTAQAPEAHGFIFVDGKHQRALVIAKGLHPLPQNQVYQVWVQQANRYLPGGTFQVKSNAWEAAVYVDFKEALSPKAKFMITREPQSQATTPTSPPLLEGMKDY